MATLKESFAKGITALNVKTNNFIEENKCKTYISTLEEEIKNLTYHIGEITVAKWKNLESAKPEIESLVQEIVSKREEIATQEEKIRKLEEEEKQILGSNISGEKASVEMIYCSQCGTQNYANYKFCCKCGKPLR